MPDHLITSLNSRLFYAEKAPHLALGSFVNEEFPLVLILKQLSAVSFLGHTIWQYGEVFSVSSESKTVDQIIVSNILPYWDLLVSKGREC